MGSQPVLHQKNIVQRGDDREGERGAQEDGARNPDPAGRSNGEQHYKKDSGDLGEGVRLAEDAGPEIAQSRDGEQHRTGGEDRDVAAEDQYRKLPGNFVQDGEDWEHRAQQELVRNRIEILAEQGLLVQLASQQSIQAIAESSNHEKNEGPQIASLDEFDHDEGNKSHPQQRELVRSGEDLR